MSLRRVSGKGQLVIWGLFSVLLIIGLIMMMPKAFSQEPEVVATVNGEPVSAREVQLQITRLKAEVMNDFSKRGLSAGSPDFWEQTYQGEQPRQMLLDRALQETVRRNLEMKLAQEHGLIPFSSYEDFLQAWKEENQRREEAVSRGEVIYGPKSYSENEYYNYLVSNIRIRLKEMLSKTSQDPLYTSEEELRQQYEDQEAKWTGRLEETAIVKISFSYDGSKDQEKKLMEAKEAVQHMNRMKREKKSVTKASWSSPGHLMTQQFTPDTYKEDIRSSHHILAVLQVLEAGEIYPEPLDSGGSWDVIQLISRSDEGGDGYENNLESIRRSAVDEKYEVYIQKLMKSASIDVQENTFSSVWKGD
ncbi:hypothetical protein [Paenibacillus lemnae]|uniref:Uncharacterized protein n=1 Tax=Paenibacillus lemnae TaxID=1330551 RepID=A0A848MCV6_PAELE|nr:hypothetical protein [Paenibacillus lemnae]NMO97862.1 hypothetical protein [Paenibacillus lemnae]